MEPVSVDVGRGERAIALVLLALGVYVVVSGFSMPSGTFSTPGPGFLPRAIGTLLAISSALVFIRSLRRRSIESATTDIGHRDILLIVVVLVVSVLVFAAFGALASLLVMTTLIVKILSERTWLHALLFAAMATGTAWLVFVRLLGLQLPGFSVF